jgi:threonine/homoserine/homoserine lactone efflux protein
VPDPERFVAFVVLVAVLIAVPGPSVLFVISRGIALGRKAAVATAVGNEAGLLVQIIAVSFGLGAVVAKSQMAFFVVKLLGALYLVYLGIQVWRNRRQLAGDVTDQAIHKAQRVGRVLREGFVVGATNPKGLLIFTAVLPQFIDPARGDTTVQFLVLGLTCITIALISDSIWGALGGTARTWLGRSPRRLEIMGAGAGAIMVGLGIQLAVATHPPSE